MQAWQAVLNEHSVKITVIKYKSDDTIRTTETWQTLLK